MSLGKTTAAGQAAGAVVLVLAAFAAGVQAAEEGRDPAAPTSIPARLWIDHECTTAWADWPQTMPIPGSLIFDERADEVSYVPFSEGWAAHHDLTDRIRLLAICEQ